MISFHRSSDKLTRPDLILEAVPLGQDWQLILTGGDKHVGALALSGPNEKTQVLVAPGHYEGHLCRELSEICAKKLNCRIAFCCGIHYDDISKDEIEEILVLARIVIEDFLNYVFDSTNFKLEAPLK